MMAFLRRNFGYKLVSLGIAILLYSIARNSINPVLSNDVYVVPEVFGVPDDMVVQIPPSGFSVTVSGPSAAVATFKNEPVKATVDLSHAKIGTNKLQIQYKLPSGDIDTSGWQTTTEVALEHKAHHDWYVDVQYDNEPPPGYAYSDPETTPKSVTVSGRQKDTMRVNGVIAVVPKAPGAWNVDQVVDLVAQDEHHQTIDSVEIDPPRARVRIPLRRAETTKTLLLSAELSGNLAPGFVISDLKFRPETLTVSGTQDTLRLLSKLTVPVPVNAANASFSHAEHVVLPTGVTLPVTGDATVQVDVRIDHVAGGMPAASPSPIAASGVPAPGTPAAPAPIAPAAQSSPPGKVPL